MSTAVERQATILRNLHANGRVMVAELSDLLRVSEVTVRSDLDQLSRRGLLVRTHGGAVKTDLLVHDVPLFEKAKKHYDEKQRIGAVAASLVHEGEIVTLDSGSTTLAVAQHLKMKHNLTVITNSLAVANELSPISGIATILTGGSIRRESLSLVGPHAEATLREHFADKVFLGVDGFDVHAGLTTPNLDEARLNRMMLDMSREAIVVTDASKFGRRSMCRIAETERLQKVITDSAIPQADAEHLRSVGIEVIIA